MEQKPYGEHAQEKAAETVAQTRAHAAEMIRTATHSGSSFLENQRRLAAAEVDGYSCALHETARQLHEQSQDRVADYAEQLAGALDSFAHHLRERDMRDSFDRFAHFARRRPMMLLGGAAAAGFAFTRFLKSSSAEESSSLQESTGEFKEKVASGVEKAKEASHEAMAGIGEKLSEGKEKMSEAAHREEKHAKRRGTHHEARTAAEVEVPVILKPHEPGHPESPAPKP